MPDIEAHVKGAGVQGLGLCVSFSMAVLAATAGDNEVSACINAQCATLPRDIEMSCKALDVLQIIILCVDMLANEDVCFKICHAVVSLH